MGDVGVSSGTYLNNHRSINSVDYTISDKDSIRARYLFNRQTGPDTAATFQCFWALVAEPFPPRHFFRIPYLLAHANQRVPHGV